MTGKSEEIIKQLRSSPWTKNGEDVDRHRQDVLTWRAGADAKEKDEGRYAVAGKTPNIFATAL